MSDYRMLIAGEWVDSPHELRSIDPSTGKPFASVASASSAHIRSAVDAAAAARESWSKLGTEGRAGLLANFVARLRAEYGSPGEQTPLKRLITTEMGKRLAEADVEVTESADMADFYVQEGPTLLATRKLRLDDSLWPTKESVVRFAPVGVVAVIKPWNYPLELPIWSIAAALVAGNTVVFKPSEHAPCVGTELARLLHEAGLPPGVLNVVHGSGEVGRELVESPDVDMVSFTGSVRVGQEIATRAAERLRRVTLELGGNDPALVFEDVDLELAANGLVWGCFANSGQVCVRPKRVFVDQRIAEPLIGMILERTRSLRVDIDYGPIISAAQLDRVEDQVQQTMSEGATVLAGAERIDRDGGYYYAPTVLGQIASGMTVMREECFGPVMPVMTFESADEAVRLANATQYGLGASVWTSDRERGARIAEELRCGMVWVNDVNVAFPQAPWGGTKYSGFGVELGEWGLHEYTVKQHIDSERSADTRRDWWYPY